MFALMVILQNPRLAGQGTPAVLQYKVTRIISREDCRQRYGATATMIHPESICTYSADQRCKYYSYWFIVIICTIV